MKAFTQIALLASVASVVTAKANKLIFKSLDKNDRTVYCTPTVGYSEMEPVTVSGGDEVKVKFPTGWIGNCYAVKDGALNVPGMLAEIAWDQYEGKHFFDVSAIVDPNDKDNVREMYPESASTPVSGCESFPCDNCYYLPDDVQTKVTDESVIIVTLGDNGLTGIDSDSDSDNDKDKDKDNNNNKDNDDDDDDDDDDSDSDSDSKKREEHPAVSRNYVMGKF